MTSSRRKINVNMYQKLKKLITPVLRHPDVLYFEILKAHNNPAVKWLDIGCGHKITGSQSEEVEQELVKNSKLVIGIDYDINCLKRHGTIMFKANANITDLPFKNEVFDLITANMVLEHLSVPFVQFQEVSRVLRPGGKFIFHTPNVLGYDTIIARLLPSVLVDKLLFLISHGEKWERFPAYYRVNNKSKITNFSKKAGFRIVKIKWFAAQPFCTLILPFYILELLFIRLLMTKVMKPFRQNIVCILEKM